MKEKQPGKSGRQQYEERAEAIAAPVAEQFGIWIYDVEYIKEGQEYYLNVYIDKDGGVTINDCEAVSRILSDELDKADFIRDPYIVLITEHKVICIRIQCHLAKIQEIIFCASFF